LVELSEPFLELSGITKRFGSFVAVDDVNLVITEGEFFTLVGPSGSGKTTMIRMLVGMDQPSDGEMRLQGRVMNNLPANKRPTCMVFQSLALFPHKSVGENIEFSMKIAGKDKVKRRARVDQLMEQLRLPLSYYDKSVTQCSGGERQRIALARALAFDPQILFFDEPLSALDFKLRKALEKELKDIHRETGKTFVYITHSLEEAMVMSDRIAIMREGRIVQVGTPHEIYNNPKNKFVAQFMGEVNTLSVEKAGENTLKVTGFDNIFTVTDDLSDFTTGFLIIRPEVMKIGRSAADMKNKIKGIAFNDYALGSRVQYQIRIDQFDEPWLVERLQDEPYEGQRGDTVDIGWRPEDSILVSN